MHNDIMAASYKERPPMLAPSSYAQCPYTMSEITHPETTPEDGDRPKVPSYTEKETNANTKPENKKLIDAEVETVHMILNRIGNDKYSTVDAYLNAKEMWIAIKRLQQG
ncbi:hypothetical protein Tco_0653867 [Tanacetum coccineum]|uniref:Uncharacterized protein n=1 Tax=Tanacetum coccineum TaxID=301880 RepID=A0ABQ4X1M4_9ASTR